MNKLEKHDEYAATIMAKIGELIDNDEIDIKELQEDDNLTHFFHALSNVVPCYLYNKITGSNENLLTFNHISNQLCFQYSKKSD